MAWSWRYEAPDGSALPPPEGADLSFPSQADAETWVGETWRELLDQGVAAVTLLDAGAEVYGPMSLSPPA